MKKQIEIARKFWTKIAKQNGWYKKPFYVQVWFDKNNNIIDSVSFKDMTGDIILKQQ